MNDKFQNKYRMPSARLPHWDYGWNASYFVTICTHNRECFLGKIAHGQMELSGIGELANQYWMEISNHFPFIELDAFVVMPNHVHGIIVMDKPDDRDHGDIINDTVGNTVETLHATSLQPQPQFTRTNKNKIMTSISPKRGSLSTIIRSYKSAVTQNARKINPYFTWQSRFHDHIIRDEKSYQTISEYIIANPLKWKDDKFNLSSKVKVTA